MSHPNAERDERVAEIRNRQVMRGNANDKWYVEDIDYLLSLYDSQAVGDALCWSKQFPAVDGAYWTRLAGDADVTLVRVEDNVAHEFGVGINFGQRDYEGCEWLGPITPTSINDAATSMRDHCIEIVKEYWQRIQGEDDEGMRELLFGALVVKLENLKLEGETQ